MLAREEASGVTRKHPPVRLPRLAVLTLACASLAMTVAAAEEQPPLLKRDWIRARSPNFVVLSMLREEATINLLRELELFRQVVFRVSSAKSDASPIPTEIFLLRRSSDIEKMGFEDRDVQGLFSPGIRNNVVLSAGTANLGQYVIQHEYVHFLVDRASSRSYPFWYSEGFAEFMAGTKIRKNDAVFGDVPKVRQSWLQYGRWIPFEKVIDRSKVASLSSEELAMAYAQSWLLVHYLHLGREGRDFAKDMDAYLDQLAIGTSDIAAFETGFGMEVDDIRGLLREYIDKGRVRTYRLPELKFDRKADVEIERPDEADVATALARAMVHLGALQTATRYADYAVARGPASGSAWATSAIALARRDRFEAALGPIERALELSPDDPFVALDASGYWLRRVQLGEPSARQRREWLARSRRQAIRASKLDASIPEIYAIYGRNLLVDGRKPDKAVEALTEAARLLPSHLEIRMDLARAHHRMGHGAEALRLATSIAASRHGGATHAEAVDLIEEITALCTMELAIDLAEGVTYDIHSAMPLPTDDAHVGSAKLSVEIASTGATRRIDVEAASSEAFGEAVLEAAQSASPFSSVSPAHRTCFSDKEIKVSIVREQWRSGCEDDGRAEYLHDLFLTMTTIVNAREFTLQPGTGRVVAQIEIDEHGAVEVVGYRHRPAPELTAKFESALEILGPLGPRPGADQCWSTPQHVSIYVVGSDNPEAW